MLPKKKFKHSGELIKELVEKMIPSEKLDHYRISAGWGKIAGTEIALHVFPRDIERQTLILETDHPGWYQKVLMRKKSILEKIQKQYSELEIRKIKVFIGRGETDST